ILTVEGDIFGAEPADRQTFNLRQLIILRVDSGEFRRSRWRPGDRINSHGPKEQISDNAQKCDYEDAKESPFHEVCSDRVLERVTIFRRGRLRPCFQARQLT